MAAGTVTDAVRSGTKVLITVTVDEGLVGMIPYTAEVYISDLKAAGTATARRQLLLNAVIAVRDARLQEETAVDAFLANLIGQAVVV